MADEVYQDNIYRKDLKFHSFRKVMNSMPAPYNECQLFSYHTASKGYMGECGFRGGYMEAHNIDPEFYGQMYKLKTISLCSNTVG